MYIIGGQFRRRKLAAPKGMNTRPTASRVREALFNVLQLYVEGARVLDLFSGSGALGLEALSRGAESVTFVEKNTQAIQALKENIADLQVEKQSSVIVSDVFKWIPHFQGEAFDLILADPPYESVVTPEVSSLATQLAYCIDQQPRFLKADTQIFIEAGEDLPDNASTHQRLVFKNQRHYGRCRIRHYVTVAGE